MIDFTPEKTSQMKNRTWRSYWTHHSGAKFRAEGRTRDKAIVNLKKQIIKAGIYTADDLFEEKAQAQPTLDAFANKWLDLKKKNIRDSTHALYRSRLDNHVLKDLGSKRIDTITNDQAQALFDGMEADGLSNSTVSGVLTLFRAIMAYAVAQRLIRHSPLDSIAIKKDDAEAREEKREAVGKLSLSGGSQFLHAIQGTPNEFRWILGLEGLRQSEALGISVKDVDLSDKSIHIHRQLNQVGKITTVKTGSSKRRIPILDEHLPLVEQLVKRNRQFLFEQRDDPISHYKDSTEFKALIKSIGLEKEPITVHSLRHWCATELYRHHYPFEAETLLGHKPKGITASVYVHTSVDQLRKPVQTMFDGWKEQNTTTIQKRKPHDRNRQAIIAT